MFEKFVRCCRLIFLFFIAVSPSKQVWAVEGFAHDKETFAPAQIKDHADRIFMVYSRSKKQPRGTAYLIHNDGKRALFITARHVLFPDKPKDLPFILRDLSLHKNGSWQNGVNDHFTSDLSLTPNEVGAIQDGPNVWGEEKLRNDIGYFVTPSSPDLPLVSLKTIGASKVSKFEIEDMYSIKHFVLGYPVLYHIDDAGSKIASIKLSLSRGEYLRAKSANYKVLFESTADSRSGNSGSPVFTQKGELLGFLVGGGISNGYLKNGEMNSKIVPIDYAKTMLGNLLLNRKSKISKATTCSVFYQPNF